MRPRPSDTTPIGRLLVERGVASLATVEEAAQTAQTADGRLCSTLLDSGACDEGDLAAALSDRLGIPGVDLSRSVVDLAAVDLVPRTVAETDVLLPLSLEPARVRVAVDSPARAARALDELKFVAGREVIPYVAVLSSLRRATAACYDARAGGAATWRGAAAADAGPAIAMRTGGPQATPLPAREADAAVRPDAPEREAAGEHVVHAVTVGGRGRVLVVDDEDAIRLLVARALQHHGYEVETATDGVDALAKLQRGQFALVLLDAMLPQMHGFDVARRIKADPALRKVAVIMMTAVYRGWRFAQDTRQSFGTHDYIEKPFRIDDLLRRVDAVLAPAPALDAASVATIVARGRGAFAAGRLEEATAAFEEAITADPFSAEAHQGLGEVLRLRGDAFRAMMALERAVELKPDLLDALRVLAALYLQKGFRAKAAEALERAVGAASDPRERDTLRRELLRLL